MQRVLNPATGEVRLVTAHEARRLKSYGWRMASLEEYRAYRNLPWLDKHRAMAECEVHQPTH